MRESNISISEIRDEDVEQVGRFLHKHLNPRVPPRGWEALMRPPWGAVGPNHGFQLVDPHGDIIGVYVAVYSTRPEGSRNVCNLAAFCVLEEHRAHSLRLLRALLRQKDYVFTDLSPSGNVPALNDRLGFRRLDTATRLSLNRPSGTRRVHVTADSSALEATLGGIDAQVYRDHREAAAARHLLVRSADEHAYLMYRRDRRKRLPIFASPLYCGGDIATLERGWPAVASYLLKQGLLMTLAEHRVLGFTPAGVGRDLHNPRVKMFRGSAVSDISIDYLYSELTLLRW